MKWLAEFCLSLDGVWFDHPWEGHDAYKVGKKIFCITGETELTIKATKEQQEFLIETPGISKAAYVGRFGWISVDTQLVERGFIEELLIEAHRQVAPKAKTKTST